MLQTLKRRLSEWGFVEPGDYLLYADGENAQIILERNNKKHNLKEINTREKLWRIMHETTNTTGNPTNTEPTKTPRDIIEERKKEIQEKNKGNQTIYTEEETKKRITETMKRWIKDDSKITDDIDDFTEEQKYAFLLGFRLARHSSAITMKRIAEAALDAGNKMDKYNQERITPMKRHRQLFKK